MCMLIRRDQLKLRFACGPCRWWLRGGVCFCGQAVPLLLRCRVPASSPGPGLRVSLCQVCVCGDRSVRPGDEHTCGPVLNSRPERLPSGPGRSPDRDRQTCVSHGAGRGCRLTAEVPGSAAPRSPGGSLTRRGPSVGPGTPNVPPYRTPTPTGIKGNDLSYNERPSRRGDRAAPLPISNATTAVRSTDQFHGGSPPGPVAPRRLRSET